MNGAGVASVGRKVWDGQCDVLQGQNNQALACGAGLLSAPFGYSG